MAYPKPLGYKYAGLINGVKGYKRFNNTLAQAIPYLPGAPNAFSKTFNFTAAPANSSQIVIQDIGATNQLISRTFTFTYAGSPGAGVIPLVAGGGTAAQAAAATKVALDAQTTNWIISVTGSVITFTFKQIGVNPTITPSSSPNANMAAVTGAPSVFGNFLPARFGKNYALLSG